MSSKFNESSTFNEIILKMENNIRTRRQKMHIERIIEIVSNWYNIDDFEIIKKDEDRFLITTTDYNHNITYDFLTMWWVENEWYLDFHTPIDDIRYCEVKELAKIMDELNEEEKLQREQKRKKVTNDN